MASIRSRGNGTTELALGKLLRAAGLLGYRKHWPVSGKPDFAWPGRKIAVFVDGCFWHGCTKCKYLPRTNSVFWKEKFAANKKTRPSGELDVTSRGLDRHSDKRVRYFKSENSPSDCSGDKDYVPPTVARNSTNCNCAQEFKEFEIAPGSQTRSSLFPELNTSPRYIGARSRNTVVWIHL